MDSDIDETTRDVVEESEVPGDCYDQGSGDAALETNTAAEQEQDEWTQLVQQTEEEAEKTKKPHDDESGREKRQEEHDETEIPMLMLDPAAVQSKADGRNGFSEAPPPSRNEKSRRLQRRRTRPDADDDGARISDDLYRRSGLELKVEELLDNSSQWRKSQQARIRTPVRRAVLSYGCVSPGRRQQILSDLNAKVRELDVAALSRGIACSLQSTPGQQQHQQRYQHQQHQRPGRQPDNETDAVRAGDGSASRLDPRVQMAYQQMMPKQIHETDVNRSQYAAPSWHNTGRLQSRGHSVRSRATRVSREVTNTTAADATVSSGNRPRRAKTSLTTTAADAAASCGSMTCVTKTDLLRLQTINGEVQRSLYTERTHGLRRLLHAGSNGGGLGGISGIGGSSLQAVPVPNLLPGKSRMTGGSLYPLATAVGDSRLAVAK